LDYIYYLLALVLLTVSLLCKASDADIGDFSTNQQINGDNTTTTTTTVNQKGQPVSTAVSPSAPSYNQDVCTVSSGSGLQSLQIGFSISNVETDPICQALKLSRQLSDLNLKVAAASVLCHASPLVFHAMMDAKTPCPVHGLIGEEAIEHYKKEPHHVPDRPTVYRSDKDKRSTERLRHDRFNKRHK